MDHKQVATRVLNALGGEDNVVGVAHCARELGQLVLAGYQGPRRYFCAADSNSCWWRFVDGYQ